MRKIQRLAAVGALAGLTVALGACTSEEEPAAGGGGEPAAAPESESSSAAPSSEGTTTIQDIFGPACAQVPTEGEGSAQGMVDDPVGTAASNNPLLSTLAQTVVAANLVDTLNDANGQYTVFAPANSAFEELEASSPGITDTLLAEPEGQLTTVLTYHVIPQRYDAQGLVEAGSVESVQGGMVEITGTPDAPVVNGNQVLCGNIPTANATVFVIDSVLMPPAA
ncbi:MAG TPA: fasciclin domain-containing protein [Pseudonocardiaceae bacterium]|nr:fasciclin domain-containing protein [Pseudonocardiaceae bacterium]